MTTEGTNGAATRKHELESDSAPADIIKKCVHAFLHTKIPFFLGARLYWRIFSFLRSKVDEKEAAIEEVPKATDEEAKKSTKSTADEKQKDEDKKDIDGEEEDLDDGDLEVLEAGEKNVLTGRRQRKPIDYQKKNEELGPEVRQDCWLAIIIIL